MKESAYIAIDMGAGSIRIMLGKLGEKLEVKEIHRFDNNPVEIGNHLRWNLKNIEEGVKFGILKAIKESDIPVSSISTDSWGVDFVLIGKDGKPIEFPVTYRDSRTDGMQEKWAGIMDKEETFQRTGINFYPFNSLFQFLAIKDTPAIKNSDKILFTANYINYFLSGVAVNELSLSSTTQMLNAEKKDWDNEILENLNIPKSKLSSPHKAGEILGKLKEDFIKSDINVVLAPGHDSANALVALPVTDDNFAFLSTGTWCVMGTESNKPFTNRLAFEYDITNEMTPDGNFRPLKNIMGLWLIQQLRESIDPSLSYTEIEKICEENKSTGYLINTDDPIFYNPEDMVSAFDQHLLTNHKIQFQKPSDYFICAYESLAQSFYNNLKILEELRGKKFNCIHITGGGCQSKILCQLTANATGLTVYAGPVEGAALGNILYQAIADGRISDVSEARTVVRKSINIKSYYPQN